MRPNAVQYDELIFRSGQANGISGVNLLVQHTVCQRVLHLLRQVVLHGTCAVLRGFGRICQQLHRLRRELHGNFDSLQTLLQSGEHLLCDLFQTVLLERMKPEDTVQPSQKLWRKVALECILCLLE